MVSLRVVGLLLFCWGKWVLADDNTCPICSDGSSMTAPATTIVLPAEEDFGQVIEPAVTCGDLMTIASTAEGVEQCDSLQVAAAARCGCPPAAVTPDCPLCASGSALPTPDFLDATIDGFLTSSKTCFDLLLEAAESRSEEECASAQSNAVLFCGCPALDNEEGEGGGEDVVVDDGDDETELSNCTLCQDGSSPVPLDPTPIIPGTPCQVLEATARTGVVTTNLCTAFQATLGLYCGCPDYNLQEEANEEICRICGSQTALPEPHRLVNILGVDTLTCAAAELEANSQGDASVSDGNANVTAFLQSGNCTAIRQAIGDDCCRTTVVDDDKKNGDDNAGSTSAAAGRYSVVMSVAWGLLTIFLAVTLTLGSSK